MDLELTAGGRRLRFPAVWLRDNCPCAECKDPGSEQKLKDITDIPNDVGVAISADAGESVVVTFAPDQHRAVFSRSWLAEHALDGCADGASTADSRHGDAGARWLSQWFGAAVTEPVRLHVAAKRYLCATEPGYFGLLSEESVRTLALQGGPMTAGQAAAFEALPSARDAVAVRRWDDEAKDPAVTPPPFAHFEALLCGLITS